MNNTALIIGGISSGKTQYALDMADGSYLPKVYIATASASDDEMQQKIDLHKTQRGSDWQTIESPINIHTAIQNITTPSFCVIDCLTLWISNMMHQDIDIRLYTQKVMETIKHTPHTLVFVSCEVGYSLVHENTLARHFQRHQGQINQSIASCVSHVDFITAGIATTIK